MEFDLFKKIIDEADKIGVGAVTIASRGEPTLHKKLDEMITYIGKKNNIFEKKLNSNATFLSENICHSVFKNDLTQIVISADHYIKEDYELENDSEIFTSGSGGIFRSGIPIGKTIANEEIGLDTINVKFHSDFSQLRLVKIVSFEMENKK